MNSAQPHCLMANVLLLRAPGDDDRYSTTFASAGYNPVSVPVLETVPTNLDSLKEIVRAGPTADGVIMTSARSCEAWKSVVDVLVKESLLAAASGLSCLFLKCIHNIVISQQSGLLFHSTWWDKPPLRPCPLYVQPTTTLHTPPAPPWVNPPGQPNSSLISSFHMKAAQDPQRFYISLGTRTGTQSLDY
jgi:Uroporphyrinogen-III synthase HemD